MMTTLDACGLRWILAAGLFLAGVGSAAQGADPVECEALASLSVKGTVVTTAARVEAGAFEAPASALPGAASVDYTALPSFCRVVGSIRPTADSDIGFELWLPPRSGWNGRFLQTGNGGAAGSIVHFSMQEPLSRGYAVANADTGHRGGMGDFSWAAGHPEKLVDYQYRAVHELTVVGKALTAAHYGTAPERSYWVGCSTGGRQGLKEAQRFPEDYDGIVAGAPANNWSALMAQSILIQNNLGTGGLAVSKLGLLKQATIAHCDARDGVSDGVIAEPARCDFDPASLLCKKEAGGAECLTPEEVAAARLLHAGLVSADGEVLMPGTGPASEPAWAAYASGFFSIGTSYFRHVVLGDPEWDPTSFDVDRDLGRAEAFDRGAAKAMDPDLSAFVGRGGKLILYHGTTDGLIPYGNTVNYFESVVETIGAQPADRSVRLYLVPGMDHCTGGEGAYEIDWLSALEEWVENDRAPGALPAAHPAQPTGDVAPFTRPACRYPEVAVYRGEGDPDDAASFACAAR